MCWVWGGCGTSSVTGVIKSCVYGRGLGLATGGTSVSISVGGSCLRGTWTHDAASQLVTNDIFCDSVVSKSSDSNTMAFDFILVVEIIYNFLSISAKTPLASIVWDSLQDWQHHNPLINLLLTSLSTILSILLGNFARWDFVAAMWSV